MTIKELYEYCTNTPHNINFSIFKQMVQDLIENGEVFPEEPETPEVDPSEPEVDPSEPTSSESNEEDPVEEPTEESGDENPEQTDPEQDLI